jgi:hypothetical protein
VHPVSIETGEGVMRLYINVAGMAIGLLAVWAVLVQ